MNFKNDSKHLIVSENIDQAGYNEIFRRAEKFIQESIPLCLMQGKIVATLFFQPSTRTQSMFQAGMIRSGGGWLGVSDIKTTFINDGEKFEDLIRTFGGYSDIIVLRHPQDNATEIAAKNSRVPVINGGNGDKEHAIGGMMMVFNMYHYLKGLQSKKIGIYGPVAISGTIKAMVKILGYYGAEVLVDDIHGNFPLPDDVVGQAKKNGIESITYDQLDNFIEEVDWLLISDAAPMLTNSLTEKEGAILKRYYKPINTEHMKRLRQDAWLDMVTPIIYEIEKDVYPDPRCIFMKKELHTELAVALMTYFLDVHVE